jgi:hypothetical protein
VLAPNPTATSKYPKIVAYVREREQGLVTANAGLWLIGDELVRVCGPPGERSKHDNSKKIMREIARELSDLGFKTYGYEMLRLLRRVSAAFPDGKRLPSSVDWSIHMAAKDPATLTAAKKEADRRKVKLTVDFVHNFRDRRKRDALSPAQRAKDDALDLMSDTDGAWEHLTKHIPNLADIDKVELQEAIADHIKNATAINDRLGPKPRPVRIMFAEAA